MRLKVVQSLIFSVLMVCGSVWAGQSYYVDSRSGSDAANGLSPETAWASLKRVNAAELKPGDTVRFACGASWRGTLIPVSGEEGNPITYTSYGKGEKPLFLGSVAKNRPEDWVKIKENLWATTTPFWIKGKQLVDLKDGKWSCHREKKADISTAINKTPEGNKFVIECRHPGTKSNHIQAWGPKIDWNKIGDAEYLLLRLQAKCSKPFKLGSVRIMNSSSPWTTAVNSGGTAVCNINTEWSDFEIPLHVVQPVDDPTLHINLGGLLPADSTFSFRCIELVETKCSQKASELLLVDVGNIIFDHGKACGWKRWKVEDVKADHDYFYDPLQDRVYLHCDKNPAEKYGSLELALRKTIINQGSRHDVVYEDLKLLYGAAHGFGGGSTARLIIRNCDLGYIGGGHQFTHENGRPVRFGNAIEFWGAARDHLIEGCKIWEVYDAALTNQGRGPTSIEENIIYRNNIIWNCEYSFEYWNNPATARTRNIQFINNTCIDAGVVWAHAQRPNPNGSHLMFYSNTADSEGIVVKYNVFYNSTDWGSRYSSGWKPLPEMNYNAWYIPQGDACFYFKERIKDVADYREKTGLDKNSFFGDFKLVDPAKGDYRVASDSPIRKLHPDGGAIGAESLWK